MATTPLLLLPVLEALTEWLTTPSAGNADVLARMVAEAGDRMGLRVSDLRISAPPLPELGPSEPASGDGARTLGALGSVHIEGPAELTDSLAIALERLLAFARGRARADHAVAELRALERAVRAIGGVLDHDRVLQLIVDEVRTLAHAQYAAIGIVDAEGVIERFITSGMTDEERAAIGHLPRGHGLLGLIIREERSYRIPDITTHPQRYGFPPNHPTMHSFLGVPITAIGRAVGRLYLTDKLGAAEFSAEDQELVELFALHAGIAIENARLNEQVRRLAVIDERDRISRDLHDSVIQAIYAQTLTLDDVPELLADDPDEARQRVDEAIDALHAVIRDIRNFIFGLRPVLLESGGLPDGLSTLATELRRNGGIEVTVEVVSRIGALDDLPIETVAELLSITREALSNIARHAVASHASVTLDGAPHALRLVIADDGRGFDVTHAPGGGHHGLANMRTRTEGMGGALTVDSSPAGTRIIITLPRRPQPATEEGA